MTRTAALIARLLVFSLPAALIACGGGDQSAPTYSLGGSITGLSTAGLVLANGSDTVSPASGATSFTFATKLAGGKAYAVSVQSQPTNATCTVANGAGTVAAGAVTSVQVSCALNSLQIGGTISGLSAAGLVLANGSDTVSPASGATSFVFGTRVTVGNAYAVSVKTQPAGLNCTLANAGGTATADVSNVAVSCTPVPVAGWSNPIVVGKGNYPQLANDPSDVAFFLGWCTCTGAGEATTGMASRYTDAGGWTSAAATTATQVNAGVAQMQFDAQGRGFGLWTSPTGNIDGSVNPMWSRYIPGVGWSWGPMPFAVMLPPVTTPPNALVYSSFPPLGLSVASDGSAVALVQEHVDISVNGVVSLSNVAALAGGAPAGTDFLSIGAADPAFPSSASTPTTVTLANGQVEHYLANTTSWPFDPVTPSTRAGQFATLFFTDTYTIPQGGTRGNDETTFGLAMNGAVITLAKFNNLAGGYAAYPIRVSKASTTIAGNGDALTSWSVLAADGGSVTVFAQRFVGGAWLGSQVIYSGQDPNYALYNALPVTALDGAGNGMIVFNALGTLTAVTMNAATGGFSAAAPIGAGGTTSSLKMSAGGNAFLLSLDGVRRYDAAGGGWSAVAPGIGGNDAVDAVLALDTTGNAMVAWDYRGSIFAARYH